MADAALPLLARPVTALNRDRVAWVVLGGGAVVYFVLSLWLTRGTTFNADELGYFADDRGFDLENIFTPHNGHLIVVTRIIYAASFNVFGVAYTPFRLAEPASGLAVAVFLFALLKRRIGAAAALAPTLVVLFLGSSPITLFPVGIQILNAVAAGLGGLLALEQRSMRWDLVACALLIVSVLSFSTGVAFVAGAAVWILAADDRWQRAWVFLAPAGIYAGWWLWAQQFDGLPLTVSNLLLTPNYGAESLASALAALTGLSYDFLPELGGGGMLNADWGRPLAVAAGVALLLAVVRGGASRSLLGFLAVAAVLWLAGALVFGPLRGPTSERYVYPIVVVVLLVGADALRGVRLSRTALIAIALVALASLATNVALLRDAGTKIRFNSDRVRAELAMLELRGDRVDPSFEGGLGLPLTAGDYLRNIERYGSFAYSISDLQRQPAVVRTAADRMLERIGTPALAPARDVPSPSDCRDLQAAPGQPVVFPLPPGGAVLRPDEPASLMLRRFASTFEIGPLSLPAGELTALRLPEDDAEQDWFAAATGPSDVTICAPTSTREQP